ncbi:MAG: WhiB family transcriptional regulator [Acidimicrobiales bacterium]
MQVSELWQNRAACRGPHQSIFFPPSRLERRSEKRDSQQRAKEICGSCAVSEQCLAYALTIRERHGIWGGLTENERREQGLIATRVRS